MQTKRRARQEEAAAIQEDSGRRSMAMHDLDFSGILDIDLLRKQCDAVAEANRNRPDVLRADLLAVLKMASAEGREKARELLAEDGTGLNCAYRISWLQDQIITLLYDFSTTHVYPKQRDRFAVAA